MKQTKIIGFFIVFIFATHFVHAAAPKQIPLKYGGMVVANYVAEPNPLKPYIKDLYTPSGVNVLLDSPPDHVHHHGVMFAIGADTTDFWAEKPMEKFGKQMPRITDLVKSWGVNQALDWITPSGKKLIEEHRAVSVGAGPGYFSNFLRWSSQLAPASGATPLKLFGSHYFGLGLRLVPDLNGKVTFIFPPGTPPGRIVRGDERLTSATWCAASGEIAGKRVTVLMFADPKLGRHPLVWFTMSKPFAYFSATLDLQTHPITLSAGEKLNLSYIVAVYEGASGGLMDTSAASIDKAYNDERWRTINQASDLEYKR